MQIGSTSRLAQVWQEHKRVVLLVGGGVVLLVLLLWLLIGGEESRLIEQLRTGSVEERIEAIDRLIELDSPKAAAAVAEAVDYSSEKVAVRAVQGLQYVKLSDKADRLKKALGDKRPKVRAVAIVVIGRTNIGANAGDLRRILTEDEEKDVRAAAAQALGRIGADEALPDLVDALDDAELIVRTRADAAIKKLIPGRDFGYRPNAELDERRAVIGKIRGMLGL